MEGEFEILVLSKLVDLNDKLEHPRSARVDASLSSLPRVLLSSYVHT